MNNSIIILLFIIIFIYVFSSITFIISLFFNKQKLEKVGNTSAITGFILHTILLLIKWISAGHGPYISRFEIILSDAWMVNFVFLFSQIFFKKIKSVGFIILPLSLIMMGFAVNQDKGNALIPPTFHSLWLVVHILFAKFAYGSLLIASALAIYYLMKEKKEEQDLKSIDELIYKFVGLGFLFLIVMIIAGALWAYHSWGRYWGWDPIESWALFTWLTYGIYLHLRKTFNFKEKKSAIFVMVAAVTVIVAYFGVPFISNSIHSVYFSK